MSDNSIFQINTAAQLSNVENIVEQWSEQKVCNHTLDSMFSRQESEETFYLSLSQIPPCEQKI